MSDEYYRVKCSNCMACEEHDNHFWCDFWCTTISDAEQAYCSYFTPHAPREEDENGKDKVQIQST